MIHMSRQVWDCSPRVVLEDILPRHRRTRLGAVEAHVDQESP